MPDKPNTTPLRIAMILPSMRRAGAESVTATLCQSLVSEGMDVHLVVIGNRFDYRKTLTGKGIHLHFLDLYQGSIRFYRQDLHWRIRRKLFKFFLYLKPDIAHFHLSHALIWGGAAAHAAGAKVFYTAHGLDPALLANDGISRWRRWTFARAVQHSHCHLLAVSSSIAQQLSLGLNRNDPVDVQPNPLENNLWQSNQQPKEDNKNIHPQIIMVGTLYPLKRVHIGLLALQRLIHTSTLPFNLWIVGDGPERSNLETMAQQLALGDRVSFLGVRDDIPALLAQADVAWLLSEREGMPMAALEAMASGVPLVATNVPGTQALVQHEFNGLLVPLDDPEAVAHTTQRIEQEETLRQHIVNGGIKTAHGCDATVIAHQHLHHYRKVYPV